MLGSIAGPSWNAWMKDLVPEDRLGRFFSHRSRNGQVLNVLLSLALSLAVGYIKNNFPGYERMAYGVMYITGGTVGLIGVIILSRT